jgi:hypothetical protein
MRISINCIICGDEIINPRVDQLCCSKKECKEEFNNNMIELWKMENPDKVKEFNKNSYKRRSNKEFGPKTI